MSKEGYIQTKIKELEENLAKAEERQKEILSRAEVMIEKLGGAIKEAEESSERREGIYRMFENEKEKIKAFHEEHYERIMKASLSEIRSIFSDFKENIRHDVGDHMGGFFVLLKLLSDKNITNGMEYADYVDKYHDEVTELSKKGLLDNWDKMTIIRIVGDKKRVVNL